MRKRDEKITKVAELIVQAESIMFFTGAGTSVHSGIPDFRSPGGIWEKYSPAEYATLAAFHKNPEKIWNFFRDMYVKFSEPEPNLIHHAITDIQQLKGENKVHIATQNIDGLHQKSGSTNVFELHGTTEKLHCLRCLYEEQVEPEKHLELLPYPICPKCKKPLKPSVILFGESLDMNIFRPAMKIAKRSDIAIGVATSLEVFPAADILLAPPPNKTKKALFNLTKTYYDKLIHYVIKGDAIETLPQLVEEVKKLEKK